MNLKVGPHHKMWTTTPQALSELKARRRRSESCRADGYALVALIALMTVLAIFALAAAPSISHQALREREIETIFRGEEVADAIRLYYSYQQSRAGLTGDAALPTSIEKLLEGVSVGTKKVQVLRASAARDAISKSGEWILVKPRSAKMSDFTQSIMLFAENVRPATNDPQLKLVEHLMAPPQLPTQGIASSGSSASSIDNSSGAFIGVTPDSRNKSILNYYGIDRHDGWVFTPLFK